MSEREAERRLYEELDPAVAEAREAELLRQKRRAGIIKAQAEEDIGNLIGRPEFIRYFFTVLARAGIYSGAFHAQEGRQHFEAGRRALGIELLDELVRADPQAPIRLSMEQAKLEETIHAIDRNPV